MAKSKKRNDKHHRAAQAQFITWLQRLESWRVLDPACGSGNFLFLALKALKDIEHKSHLDAAALGLDRQQDLVTGPDNVLGIEINEYAAELARVTIWIGELQWRIEHGYPFKTNPILEPLDHIECRDALIASDPASGVTGEAKWPNANVVVGNPPFLGTKKQWSELGVDYSERLRGVYAGRVPGFADLVCYWFEKARAAIEKDGLGAAGLVATNSIRGGANRQVLDRIVASTRIFEAWSDTPWVNEGAAVRVSLVAFGHGMGQQFLDGKPVDRIHADLTAGTNLTGARKLRENVNCSFVATVKAGAFDVPGETARRWLQLPNAHGRSSADVLKRWANGMDMTRRWSDTWIVDFGLDMSESDASLYEVPFEHVRMHVKPERDKTRAERERCNWWLMARPIPAMRVALRGLSRFIATPVLAKYRLFVWMHASILPDHQLVVTARADDTTFGMLHCRFHELWSLRMGTSLEDRPRYTPTTCFETFPFPQGLAPADTANQHVESAADGALIPAGLNDIVKTSAVGIARASKRLNDLREGWLNPPEWTDRVPEVVPLGMARSPYPDRILPKHGHEKQVAARTLTNLYNQRPAWLDDAHKALDQAVAAAYGWTDYSPAMSDEMVLSRLVALNLERSQAGSAAICTPLAMAA